MGTTTSNRILPNNCDVTNGGFTLVWNFYPTHTPRKYLTVRLSVCPSMCLYAYPPICLSVPIHGYPPICCAYPPMSVCLSMAIHPSAVPIHPCLYAYPWLSTHLSVYLSTHISVYLSICLSMDFSHTFLPPVFP